MKPGQVRPLGGFFEKLDEKTGGVAGQVGQGVKQAAQAVTVDVVKGVAQAPVEAIRQIAGDDPSKDTDDSGSQESGSSGIAGQGTVQGPTNSDFSTRLSEERKKREMLIRQQRSILHQFEQEHEKTKKLEEQRKHDAEQLDEQSEKQKIIQLEHVKKALDPGWKQAIQGQSGSREGTKKKF